jgi:hypothetical protein
MSLMHGLLINGTGASVTGGWAQHPAALDVWLWTPLAGLACWGHDAEAIRHATKPHASILKCPNPRPKTEPARPPR